MAAFFGGISLFCMCGIADSGGFQAKRGAYRYLCDGLSDWGTYDILPQQHRCRLGRHSCSINNDTVGFDNGIQSLSEEQKSQKVKVLKANGRAAGEREIFSNRKTGIVNF